jgi:hypothetical protein
LPIIVTSPRKSSLAIRKFPLTKEKYEEIKVKLEALHDEKREKTRSN